MKSLKNSILFTILPFLMVACGTIHNQQAEIKNIKNKETIILKKLPSQGNVHGIKIKISGYINEEAKISLILNQEEYKTEILKGNFTFDWIGDWYADTAEVIYKPLNVQSGKVTLKYRFLDLK